MEKLEPASSFLWLGFHSTQSNNPSSSNQAIVEGLPQGLQRRCVEDGPTFYITLKDYMIEADSLPVPRSYIVDYLSSNINGFTDDDECEVTVYGDDAHQILMEFEVITL
ncbi:hypothetical protein RIF29_25175 [Crotalaria pallida]|uniref:Uncharacterized protein n=1 Tax=Crotalaria pallida TaxID=3830 RepID=A0AAN9ELU2_CROPI